MSEGSPGGLYQVSRPTECPQSVSWTRYSFGIRATSARMSWLPRTRDTGSMMMQSVLDRHAHLIADADPGFRQDGLRDSKSLAVPPLLNSGDHPAQRLYVHRCVANAWPGPNHGAMQTLPPLPVEERLHVPLRLVGMISAGERPDADLDGVIEGQRLPPLHERLL